MPRPKQRKNSNRLDRIDEELKKEISQVINYELNNSKIKGIISVTKVKITPDLRYAKVYISVLNSNEKGTVLTGLKESSGYIRSKIASTINLRLTPELVFVYDDSEEKANRIEDILRDLKKDRKE